MHSYAVRHLALAATLLAICAESAVDADPHESLSDDTELAREAPLRALQRCAVDFADLGRSREAGWHQRVRWAALVPSLRLRAGRSNLAYDNGAGWAVVTTTDSWRFDLSASWAIDRLVFDRDELAVAREAQHRAARREQLIAEVTKLYYARARKRAALAADPPATRIARIEAQLQIDELTAILGGLAGGPLATCESRSRR